MFMIIVHCIAMFVVASSVAYSVNGLRNVLRETDDMTILEHEFANGLISDNLGMKGY